MKTCTFRNRSSTAQVYTLVRSLLFDGSYVEGVMFFVLEISWLCLEVKCVHMCMYFINQTFVQFHSEDHNMMLEKNG